MDFETDDEELVNVEDFDNVENSMNVWTRVLYSQISSVLKNATGCWRESERVLRLLQLLVLRHSVMESLPLKEVEALVRVSGECVEVDGLHDLFHVLLFRGFGSTHGTVVFLFQT